MRTIDIHAHLMPQCYWRAFDQGLEWYGYRHEPGDKVGPTVGKRNPVANPKFRFTAEERIKDMDAQGMDVHVVSVIPSLLAYKLEAAQGLQLARDVNDEIATMVRQWPQRFTGLATLPAQDVKASIEELERAVTVLGLKGAELDTVVNGQTWDNPQFLPLFKAAEEMGALLFFHPQPMDNLILQRTDRYGLYNSIGVLVEDALVVAALIFGGILEKFPKLKVCIAHGGGMACYGMGRMDRAWEGRPMARVNAVKPPSTYQRLIYYDCLTQSEAALRFLIDQVGADRVVLGSDWPYVPVYGSQGHKSVVQWVKEMDCLTPQEKEKILWKNLEALLEVTSG